MSVSGSADDGRRPRVLLSAYTVDPLGGSESMVGWQRSVQSARYFDTWVMCAPDESREGIEQYVREHGPIGGLTVVYVDKPVWGRFIESLPGLFYLSYNLWQRRALRTAERLHDEVGFDLTHQVNLCGFREPGYLWKLDPPFIWGPVGGTQNYPTRLLRQAGLVGGAKEAVRTSLNRVTVRWSRRVRFAARRATVMQAANRTVAADLGRVLDRNDIDVMLEVGSPEIHGECVDRGRRVEGPFRLLWAGQFHAFKALPQLLEALSALPDTIDWHLVVAGDGPERSRWRRKARELGVDDRIQWLGWLEHDDMHSHYAAADVFVFTSLRDTTGSVVLEALAAGTPVIGPRHQGVGDVVDGDCGILIPVTSHQAMVDGYRRAVLRLATDVALLEGMRVGAIRRAEQFSWPRQGERMRDVYLDVIARAERNVTG